MGLIADSREVVASRELLVNLIRRELRSKYKGTALGWAWSLINPLASTAIFTAVFSLVLRVEPPIGANGLHNYALFLLCGLLSWNFMSGAVTSSMGSLVGNGNLIKKTYFPRRLLVIANVASLFVTYAIEMGVLAVVFLLFGVNVLPWLPLVALVMVVLAVFSLGLSLLLSVANVYFRDVAHFVSIAMQVWFYATPIIYPITYVESARGGDSWAGRLHIADIYLANPMVAFVESIRDMLYAGTWPSPAAAAYAIGISILALWIGNAVFGRRESRLAEEL